MTEPGALMSQCWEQKSSVGGGGDRTQVQKENEMPLKVIMLG